MSAINAFSPAPARDGTLVTSTVDRTYLLTLTSSDPYFDSTDKFGRVDVYYYDSSNRDMVIVTHSGSALTGLAAWSQYAPAGTWYKNRVRVKDFDDAELILGRATIGSGEDLTLS